MKQLSEQARHNERLRMNFNFHPSSESKSQRLLNALEPGTVIPVHRHRHTDETYLLLCGSIRVFFYAESGAITTQFELNPSTGNYGLNIPRGQWHGLEVLEPNTVIFEVKDGPYTPLSKEDILNKEAPK